MAAILSQPQCVKKVCLVEEEDYKSILSDGLEQCIILSRNAHNQNKHIISQKWHYQINSAIWCLYWINSEINYKWLPTNGLNTPSLLAESQGNCLIGTWYQLLNLFNLLASRRFKSHFREAIFKLILRIIGHNIYCEIIFSGPHWWKIKIGSGTGFVQSGWCKWASNVVKTLFWNGNYYIPWSILVSNISKAVFFPKCYNIVWEKIQYLHL